MPVHPDPAQKLFGWRLDYATGQSDYGLIVAASETEAYKIVAEAALAGIKAITITDQTTIVDILNTQYRGMATFTTELSCN